VNAPEVSVNRYITRADPWSSSHFFGLSVDLEGEDSETAGVRLQHWSLLVPLGGLLVGVGDPKRGGLIERSGADLQTDR
jgi:hypothetical protein